jgi:hypothetical protein
MKAKKYWVAGLVAVFCVVLWSGRLSGVSWHEGIQLKRFGFSTLKGLKGVSPMVNLHTGEGVNLTHTSESKLQIEVELELRKAGVKVFSDPNETPVALFRIQLSVDRAVPKSVRDLPYYTVDYSAELYQHVVLLRNPEIVTLARTWPFFPSLKGVAASETDLEEGIKELTVDMTKDFINDYLAANPKAAGLSLSPFKDKTTWVKCRNPQCGAEYEMNLKAYHEFIEKNIDPKKLAAPAMTCGKCGEPSVYRAVKCGKCGMVFKIGSIPRDFGDRCPKCGYSQVEKDRERKKAARRQ